MLHFFCDDIEINTRDLNSINLGDNDLETIIDARLVTCCNKFKQHRALGKRNKHIINACSMASK